METNENEIDFTGFEKQLEHTTPITESTFENIKEKKYSSGVEKKIGDLVLFGFEELYDVNNEGEVSLKLIVLSQDEIKKYKVTPNKSMIPTLKLKQ